MNQVEKKNILIAKIEQERSELKKLLIETVKRYGVVDQHPLSNKVYYFRREDEELAIDSFILEDGLLFVSAFSVDTSYELPADEFDIVDLANWMFSMIEDRISALQKKVDTLSDEYISLNNTHPKYAKCEVYYPDDGDWVPATVKLSVDLEDDDSVFHYFNSLEDLKCCTSQGVNDFIITDIYELI